MSLTSVDLPEPETPVTATRSPSGKRHRHLVEVVLAWRRRRSTSRPFSCGRRTAGVGISRRPDRYSPVSESGWVEQVLDRAGVHDLAAVLARAGADVDDPVGGGDGVLVVLDDDERVAEVAQPGQGLDEPVVVALVQADARLVEHVEDADEAGADLGGQPDALRLAAGERARRAVEGEVVEADVEQEAEPGVDLLDDPLGDLPLARR